MHSWSLGIPELAIVLVIAMYWAVPIAFGIWVFVTLRRIRAGQQAVEVKLEAIERLLQRP
jgi:TRAP-type C4-dicarboxylate transport system permease small subunit